MTYTTVMLALQQGGQWQRAIALLDQMREKGVKPDSKTYASVIATCVSSQQWKRAFKVLQRMQKDCPVQESRKKRGELVIPSKAETMGNDAQVVEDGFNERLAA